MKYRDCQHQQYRNHRRRDPFAERQEVGAGHGGDSDKPDKERYQRNCSHLLRPPMDHALWQSRARGPCRGERRLITRLPLMQPRPKKERSAPPRRRPPASRCDRRPRVQNPCRHPRIVTDTVAKVIEQRKGPAEQQQLANQGSVERLYVVKCAFASRGSDKPHTAATSPPPAQCP